MTTLTKRVNSNQGSRRGSRTNRRTGFGTALGQGSVGLGSGGSAVPRALASQVKHVHGTGGAKAPRQRPTYGCLTVPWQ